MGKYKYIQAPKPEFYDLSADPGEQHNLYPTQGTAASAYAKRIKDMRARFPTKPAKPAGSASPEVIASLRSLGYLSGGQPSLGSLTSGPDPKDYITDYSKYRHALTLATAGSLRESNAQLEAILAQHPDLREVRNMLALNQQRMGQHEAAAKNFRQVLQSDPQNAAAHLNLATSFSRLDRMEEALKEDQAAIAIASQSGGALEHVLIPAKEMLGAIRIRNAEYDKARDEYMSLLKLAPANYEAHYNLAWLDSREGHAEEALRHLQAAVKSDPDSAGAHNALGSIYLQRRDLEDAGKEFAEAARLDPKLIFAHYNLGLVLQLQGSKQASADEFRAALKIDPNFRPAQKALAQLGLN